MKHFVSRNKCARYIDTSLHPHLITFYCKYICTQTYVESSQHVKGFSFHEFGKRNTWIQQDSKTKRSLQVMFREVVLYGNGPVAPGNYTGACPANLDICNRVTYVQDFLLQSIRYSCRSGIDTILYVASHEKSLGVSGQVIGLTMRLVLSVQSTFLGTQHSTGFAPGCAHKEELHRAGTTVQRYALEDDRF